MNTRDLIAALTSLCGATPDQIAEGATLPVARVQEAFRGWPLRPGHRKAINAYARTLLRSTHAAASKRLALPELQQDTNAHRHVRDLEDAYKAAFGLALLDDVEKRCERCACMKAFELLGYEPTVQELYDFVPPLGAQASRGRSAPMLVDLAPNPPPEHADASLQPLRPPSRFPEWAKDFESQALLRLIEIASREAMYAYMRIATEGATRPELQSDPEFIERSKRVGLARDLVMGRLARHHDGRMMRLYRAVPCTCKPKGKRCR